MPVQTQPILIIGDDSKTTSTVACMLKKAGHGNVALCNNIDKAMRYLSEFEIETVLLDIRTTLSGENLISKINGEFPAIPVIAIGGEEDFKTAGKYLAMGAFDYIPAPVEPARLVSSITRAIEIHVLKRENAALKKHLLSDGLENRKIFSEIVTCNKTMKSILKYVELISRTSTPVLITGEKGVGKKLLATAIHGAGDSKGNMICAEPPDFKGVLSKVLSGSNRAERRTFFLCGIEKMENLSQSLLFRLILEGENRLGPDEKQNFANCRIVASASEKPSGLKKAGFRDDLLAKLESAHIHIPPLRERREDIPLLVTHFLDIENKNGGKREKTFTQDEIAELLADHPFNGNVDELRDMVSGGFLEKEIRRASAGVASPFPNMQKLPTIKESTKLLISEAMKRANGNQSAAAKLLGITQPALSYHIRKK